MPSGTTHYDAILLGSGQGGTPLAGAFAKAGPENAHRAYVGGTCINEGCTPTKTMVASGRSSTVSAVEASGACSLRASAYGTGVFQVAMMGGLPYTALRDSIFSHPTMAESLNNLFASLDS